MTDFRKLHLLIALALPLSLAGQSKSIYSSIVGTITDPSGGTIANASVRVRNINTGIESEATTNAGGFFRVEKLIAGVYNITAEAAGFRTYTREKIDLSTAQDIRADLTMSVGAVSVVSSIPLIETESPQVYSTLDFEDRKFLPTRDNSFYSTLALESGAVMANPSFYVSFAGSRTDQYNYSIDGQTFRSPLAGHNAQNANFSEWQEQAKTNYVNNSAEYSTLANVDATTKSGGNAVHGSGAFTTPPAGCRAAAPFRPIARPATTRSTPLPLAVPSGKTGRSFLVVTPPTATAAPSASPIRLPPLWSARANLASSGPSRTPRQARFCPAT